MPPLHAENAYIGFHHIVSKRVNKSALCVCASDTVLVSENVVRPLQKG